jgi:two-component system response regulator AlgR
LNMRMLVVDNQPRARQSMKALLGAWYPAAKLREAADGYQAVQLAEEFQPDLILMDARMPRMNGLEAVRHIKGQSDTVKIIIISMYADLNSEALSAGADAFISKSDAPEKIKQTIEGLIPVGQKSIGN